MPTLYIKISKLYYLNKPWDWGLGGQITWQSPVFTHLICAIYIHVPSLLCEAGTLTTNEDDKQLKYSRFPQCVVPHSEWKWKILPFAMSAYLQLDSCPHTEAFLHSSATCKYSPARTCQLGLPKGSQNLPLQHHSRQLVYFLWVPLNCLCHLGYVLSMVAVTKATP